MKIIYPENTVAARITEIAHEIVALHPSDKPLFVCLLKGAVPFTSKLMSAITRIDPVFYPEVEYLHVSAYGDERQAAAAKFYTGIEAAKIAGRNILVVDDCLDQGITYGETKRYLLELGATSVQLIVLANKQVTRPHIEQPLISGFNTPNIWLVGMGMDDSATASEAERWAEYIGDAS